MATADFRVTLTSPNLTSDIISLNVLNTISSVIQGGVQRERIISVIGGTFDILADEGKFTTGCRVWLYNPSTGSDTVANYIYIVMDDAVKSITLKPGDWAVIPWTASTNGTPKDLKAYAGTTLNVLEYGVFQ